MASRLMVTFVGGFSGVRKTSGETLASRVEFERRLRWTFATGHSDNVQRQRFVNAMGRITRVLRRIGE